MPNRETVERALIEWAEHNARRDDLVRMAIRVGVSKHRIHVLTGIARTTIDRIVEPLDDATRELLRTGARRILDEYETPPAAGTLVPRAWVEENRAMIEEAAT